MIMMILTIGGCLIAIMLLLQLIYILTDKPKFIFHDLFGQHKPDIATIDFDKINVHAKCRICGKDILRDSQGNWF